MDTILDEYSIEGRTLLDVDITEGKEVGYQFIFNTKTDDNKSSVKLKLEVVNVEHNRCEDFICPLKEYRCDGINCNVKLVEILK